MSSLFTKTKEGIVRRYRMFHEQGVERRIRTSNPGLWNTVNEYHKKIGAGSLRKNWLKYGTLYHFIKSKKPKEILELGAGTSTVVIAHALMENEREVSQMISTPRVTSMEESPQYHARTVGAFPEHLKKYTEIILSAKVEDYYQLFRGVKYKDVPERPYELVFVDGPTTGAPSDGHKTFDFDFLNVVARSERPVYGIVDLRLSGMWVYEKIFGRKNVRLSNGGSLGLIGPVARKDMRTTNSIVSRHRFRSLLWSRW